MSLYGLERAKTSIFIATSELNIQFTWLNKLPGFKKLTSGVKILFHVEPMQIKFYIFREQARANSIRSSDLVWFISSYEIPITAIHTYSKEYTKYKWISFTVLSLSIGYSDWKTILQSPDTKNHEIQSARQFDNYRRTNICSICWTTTYVSWVAQTEFSM